MTEKSNEVATPTATSDRAPDRLMIPLREGNPYLPVHVIGGQGGIWFYLSGGYSGNILQKIGVWVGPSMIKAVRLWFTNGTIVQHGNPGGPYSEFAFEHSERIQTMSLWGNGAGTRLGAIKFRTSQNREFFAKMTEWGLKQEYPIG